MEDRLYKFAKLVDAGSFTRGAKAMHISQPALTTAVKKLERELHSELLIRGSHEFRLTAAGQMAYDTAKQIGLQADNLKTRLAEISSQKIELRLGMIDSLADMLFVNGDSLSELEQGTHLSLTVDNSDRLIDYIERDELDLALVANPSALPANLMTINLGKEPLVLVTHKELARQVKDELKQEHLGNFLGYNQHSHTYQLVKQHFADHGVELKHSFYSTSPEIMLELILAKRGVAALPYMLVKQHLADGTLAAIKFRKSCVIARNIVSVHRSGRSMPLEANGLLAKTQSHLALLNAEANLL